MKCSTSSTKCMSSSKSSSPLQPPPSPYWSPRLYVECSVCRIDVFWMVDVVWLLQFLLHIVLLWINFFGFLIVLLTIWFRFESHFEVEQMGANWPNETFFRPPSRPWSKRHSRFVRLCSLPAKHTKRAFCHRFAYDVGCRVVHDFNLSLLTKITSFVGLTHHLDCVANPITIIRDADKDDDKRKLKEMINASPTALTVSIQLTRMRRSF